MVLQEKYQKNNINTFTTINLGCKVNLYETNAIKNQFLEEGIIFVENIESADIVLINTCSVTNTAEAKSKSFINKVKRKNSKAILIVAGCYSQVNKTQNKDIDIYIGNKYKSRVIDLLNEYLENKKAINKVENLLIEKKYEEISVNDFTNNTRAFVKIQDGCNYMCSYCIIPFSRGRQRSRDKENILKEINNFVLHGYKEIVLTGVNTAGYGENNEYKFFDLLKDIDEIKGDFRVRISSVEPFQIKKEILDIILNNKDRWAQHLHLCIQTATNKILRDMNRKNTIEEFADVLNYIRNKNELFSITTDYIVGYPTETLELHKEALLNLKELNFSDMHIFSFSPKKNTRAALIKQSPTLSSSIKRHYNDVSELNKKQKKLYLERIIGKNLDIVFEESKSKSIQTGYSSEYVKVLYKSENNLKGQRKKMTAHKIIDDIIIVK